MLNIHAVDLALGCAAAFGLAAVVTAAPDPPLARAADEARRLLVQQHGAAEAERIDRGVAQVLRYWRPADGDAAALSGVPAGRVPAPGETLDRSFDRFEFALERRRRLPHLALARPAAGDGPRDRPAAAARRAPRGLERRARTSPTTCSRTRSPSSPCSTSRSRRSRSGSRRRRRGRAGSGPRRGSPAASRRACPADVSAKLAQAYAAADAYIAGYNSTCTTC